MTTLSRAVYVAFALFTNITYLQKEEEQIDFGTD